MNAQHHPQSRTFAPDADITLPLPPATTGACWASTAARLERQAKRFNELQCACHAMDAGDRSAGHTLEPHERITLQVPPDVQPPTVPEQIEAARSDGFDAGVQAGAERRSLYDLITGAIWGFALVAVVMLASAGAGFLSVRWGG